MTLGAVRRVTVLRVGDEHARGCIPLRARVGATDQIEVVVESLGAEILKWRTHHAAVARAVIVLQVTKHRHAQALGIDLKLAYRLVIAIGITKAQAAPLLGVRVIGHQTIGGTVGVAHQVSDLVKVSTIAAVALVQKRTLRAGYSKRSVTGTFIQHVGVWGTGEVHPVPAVVNPHTGWKQILVEFNPSINLIFWNKFF